MTNPISEVPAWHNWAWKQLGAPPEASPAEANLAALAVLAQSDFEPAGELRPALQMKQALDHSSTPPGGALAAFQKSSVQELRDSIEKFAQNYWSMPPAERLETYQLLAEEAKNVPLAKLRLEGLRDGLTIEAIAASEEDPTRKVARSVQALYVLAPLERAVRRHELAGALRNQVGSLVALQLLAEDFPEIARLDRSFNSRLLEPPRKLKLTFKHLEEPVQVQPVRANSFGGTWWSGGRVAWIAIFVISSVVRICAMPGGHPSRSDSLIVPGNQRLHDLQLETVTHPDGTQSREVVNKNGVVVPLSPELKNWLELDERDTKRR